MPAPWEQNYDGVSSGKPWESFDSKPDYGYVAPENESGNEVIHLGNSNEMISAPVGTGQNFSNIQSNDTFDTPSSAFEETGAMFEKQAAYISLVANAFGLVGDDEINEFISDRSLALASAQARQPEYMKEFNQRWEDAEGIFEGTGVILSSPQALGRQILTQSANAALPLLTTAGGGAGGAVVGSSVPVVGTAIGGVVGSVGGAFAGGAIIEVGAEIDGMISEAGYDITNPDQVLEALQNDQLMDDIKVKAAKKGLTTASVDALFQVVGGRFLKAAKIKGSGKVGTAAAGVADVGVQSAGEGIGEAAGQFAKDGTVDVKSAVLESITSLGQSAGQTAIGTTVGKTKDVAIDTISAGVEQARVKADKAAQSLDTIDFDNAPENEINSIANTLDVAEAELIEVSQAAERQIEEIRNQETAVYEQDTAKLDDLNNQLESAKEIINAPKGKDAIKKPLVDFLKKQGKVKSGSPLAKELANMGITPKTQVGLFKNDGKLGALDNFPVSEFKTMFPNEDVKSDDGVYVNEDFLLERISQESFTRGAPISEQDAQTNEFIAELDRLGLDIDTATPQQLFEALEGRAPTQKQESDLDELGAPTPIPSSIENTPALTQKDVAMREKVKEQNAGFISGMFLPVQKFGQNVSTGFGKALVPISTRIKNISPKLFVRIRRFEYDVKKQILEDEAAVKPFLRAMRKLDNDTQIDMDLALKNGNMELVDQIAEVNGFSQETAAVKDILNNIYDRAQAANVDVNYRWDFFPRRVNDLQGLMDHLKGGEYWNVIQEAVKKKEDATGKTLNDAEVAGVANTLFRGFKVEGISLAQRGIFKERSIENITTELNQFYDNSEKALLAYMYNANEAIETAKLFGKGQSLDGNKENISDSVGSFINEMVNNGDLTNRQSKILKDILNARFNDAKMGEIWAGLRDLSYIDTMGSPLNAITQFADLTTSMYNAGIFNTVTTLGGAITDRTKINLQDVTIDDDIAQEFDNSNFTSGLVTKVFKLTGLQKMDRVGKLTLVNSDLKKLTKQAKKGDKQLLSKLDLMFGEDAGTVLQDLKDGNLTDDVKFLTFNTLLDMQPVAKSEMPEYYLRSGNLKILYMLKTFTIKQLDIYRREVVSNMHIAAKTGDAKLAAQAVNNFVRLAGFWITMGASADYMKDMLRSAFGGDEMEEPENYVIDNIFKAFGWSRYQSNMLEKKGTIEVSRDLITPPTKFLTNLRRDFKAYKKDGLDLNNSRSIRSIPIGGELYYFWFGGKSGSEEKAGVFNE